jgi:hypothetical protein
MSVTTPAPAPTALTWANAPREYRRSAYFGMAARAFVPLLSTLAFAWATSGRGDKVSAVIAAVAMTAMISTLLVGAWKYRRTAKLVLPREHKVELPRKLTRPTQIIGGGSEIAFAALLLANNDSFAVVYAILTCVLSTNGLWTVLYEKGIGWDFWASLTRTVTTLAVMGILAPEHLVAAAIWAIAVPVAFNALLFIGVAMDDQLDEVPLRPWAARAGAPMARFFAIARA